MRRENKAQLRDVLCEQYRLRTKAEEGRCHCVCMCMCVYMCVYVWGGGGITVSRKRERDDKEMCAERQVTTVALNKSESKRGRRRHAEGVLRGCHGYMCYRKEERERERKRSL